MQVSQFTTAGIRDGNEDSLCVALGTPAGDLLAVADGLGGHADGSLASELACHSLAQVVEHEDPASFVLGGQRMDEDELRLAFLSDAVRQAGAALWHEARQRGSDMGSTLLAVLLKDGRGYAAQVGDCALFVSDGGPLPPAKLTVEHRRGKSLTRSLGAQEQVTPDVFSFAFDEGSVLLLGCDGFWEHVTPEAMHELLLERPPFCAAEELGHAALQAGSHDNVSVIVVEGERFVARHAGGQIEVYAAILAAREESPEVATQREALLRFAARHAAGSPRIPAIMADLLQRLPDARASWAAVRDVLPPGILDQLSQMIDVVALAPDAEPAAFDAFGEPPGAEPAGPSEAPAPDQASAPAVPPATLSALSPEAPESWPEEPARREAEYLRRIERLELAQAELQREIEVARAMLREREATVGTLRTELDKSAKTAYTYKRAALRLGERLLDLWQGYPKECEQLLTRDWLLKVDGWLQQQGLQREPPQPQGPEEGKSLWERIRRK